MKLITISGPPSSEKTSIFLQFIPKLKQNGYSSRIIKIDCLHAKEFTSFTEIERSVVTGLSTNLCPDYFLQITFRKELIVDCPTTWIPKRGIVSQTDKKILMKRGPRHSICRRQLITLFDADRFVFILSVKPL